MGTKVCVRVCMCVFLNENKAELLTVADFCSTAQVEFPIRGSYTGTMYQRSAAPMHRAVVLQRPQALTNMELPHASQALACTDK